MRMKLNVWRQNGRDAKGAFQKYDCPDVSEHMSFLEMLDVLNERIESEGQDPIAFEHDCREGICGSCGFMINGAAHGPQPRTTVCQLHMRSFKDGDELWLEPWRAKAFPVVRDLVVDRTAFDRIVQAGGYISTNTGSAPEANAAPIRKDSADKSFDAAACIGCGACVAMCPNASASLFTAAKLAHLNLLPQGQPERLIRSEKMVVQMDVEGFGHCTNHSDCEAVCPKGISVTNIAMMNLGYVQATLLSSPREGSTDD
ncbi:MAG: succinate dehydrogenase/fumarate reductase iron-sulfur subunit [Myxococcales bacterium]|nr:succinate dehydrogenase/fumarate reductase iron-sulfur subunit [Myxococcales bacterium]